MPPEDLITFAWPCGVTNSRYKLWLSDYYLFARGYYKNVMGSKNPVDMMEFKSINSIGFGQLPPDYYLLADTAENHQEWINYVYHDSCDNPEIFDYLLDKGLWVDTIGSVSKYIVQRNSAGIENVVRGEGRMEFDVVSPLDTRIFDKELTLMIYTGNEAWGDVIVNGKPTQVTRAIKGGRDYFLFNIPPGNAVHVEVIGLSPDTPLCGDGKVNLGREECDDGNENDGDGCSSKCKIEGENRIYILSYVGNIDGTADKSWYYFFDNITAYYEKNQIPVAFSFFPESMKPNNYEFSEVFRRMYLAENIELMQKGYRMDEYEKHLETLDPKVQKYIIEAGRHTYLNRMKAILGKDPEEISFPTTYVAPYGRMSPSIRKALEEMGFRVSFGVYYVDELGPVESTANTDMYQYAVSFTQDGSAGRNTTFKTSDEIIAQVLSYDRADLPMVKINGKKVIPLYVHQPDFEHPENNSVVDEEKWKIYTETIERLYNNPNVTFITPSDAWALRHPVCIPTGFSEKECNWIDDDCDGRIDEECDPHSYLYNFSYSEYGLGYDEDKFGPEYFRDYFRKGSIMDRMSIFVYAIYDWAFYSTKGVRDRF
ncbi:MAG: DUF4215 domain-containing protein [Candidatus Aenigmarchaeota archaeon]|nr:DUF4215 domain-containing protein [Candidatus Aenigmarchaeota archaeon]